MRRGGLSFKIRKRRGKVKRIADDSFRGQIVL